MSIKARGTLGFALRSDSVSSNSREQIKLPRPWTSSGRHLPQPAFLSPGASRRCHLTFAEASEASDYGEEQPDRLKLLDSDRRLLATLERFRPSWPTLLHASLGPLETKRSNRLRQNDSQPPTILCEHRDSVAKASAEGSRAQVNGRVASPGSEPYFLYSLPLPLHSPGCVNTLLGSRPALLLTGKAHIQGSPPKSFCDKTAAARGAARMPMQHTSSSFSRSLPRNTLFGFLGPMPRRSLQDLRCPICRDLGSDSVLGFGS